MASAIGDARAHSAGATTPGDALQELLRAPSLQYDAPPTDKALRLAVAPPPPDEEWSHERAFGFHFADEMKVVRQLQARHEQGRALFMKVYCARSCACAVPPLASETDVAKVLRYYGAVYEVLQPQVEKLRMLCDYCTQTVVALSDTIQRIAAQENTHRVIPDVLLDSIVDVMDIVLQMNQLHDTKGSLRNDFSLFKRAFKYVKGDISDPDAVAKEIQRLQEFVGNSAQSKGSIWDSLRHNLTSVKRFDQVIHLLVKHSLSHLETERCMLPDDHFKFIRVLPCLMAVLNAEFANGKGNGFHGAEKRLVDTAIKAIIRFPVVPIFADLCVRPMAPFSSRLTPKVETYSPDSHNWDSRYDLVGLVSQVKDSCQSYLPRLVFAENKIRNLGAHKLDDKTASKVFELISEGLRYLAEWKTSVLLFLSMKLQTPKTDDQLRVLGANLDAPCIEYERVVKHNFDPTECTAMIEVVHAIKSVTQVIRSCQLQIGPCLSQHMQHQLQVFVQHTLTPVIHRADKKKHSSTKLLQEIRLACGDWTNENVPAGDFKKRRRERQLPGLRNRDVHPARSQLQIVRTIVNSIYARRTTSDMDPKSGLFSFRRHLKSSDVDAMHHFYVESSEYAMILDLDSTLDELSSFSSLWFREIYLEIARAPQVPVEDSLPWILLKRSIGHDVGASSLAVLSLLDVYNDASREALRNVQLAYIYDEVVAEGKLFFDHLVYLLADQAYSVAKSDAAREFVGAECIQRLQTSAVAQIAMECYAVTSASTVATVSRNTLEVVDLPANLMLLVSGHVNSRLARDLGATVNKMANADATVFVATANLVEVLRATHRALSHYLQLDIFDCMWSEASGRLRCGDSNSGNRFRRFSAAALTQDLTQNFGYNERTRRYFRTPLPTELRLLAPKSRTVDAESIDATKDTAIVTSRKVLDSIGLERECRLAFEIMHRSYRSFVGIPHMEAIVALTSPAELVQVVNDIIDYASAQIEDILDLCVPVLGAAIPPYRLPKMLYRAEGCYGYFESKFKHMMDSRELETHVFQCLRGLGNAMVCIRQLGSVVDAKLQQCQSVESFQQLQATPSDNRQPLFNQMLQRLYQLLHDTELISQWGCSGTANPEKVDNPSTFFLVWNALEYLSCCPRQGVTYREHFGDGVYFAGCTIIHLLGQRTLYDTWNPSEYVLGVHRHDSVKLSVSTTVQHVTKGRKFSGAVSVSSPSSKSLTVGTLDSEMVESTRIFVAQATQMRQATLQISKYWKQRGHLLLLGPRSRAWTHRVSARRGRALHTCSSFDILRVKRAT